MKASNILMVLLFVVGISAVIYFAPRPNKEFDYDCFVTCKRLFKHGSSFNGACVREGNTTVLPSGMVIRDDCEIRLVYRPDQTKQNFFQR